MKFRSVLATLFIVIVMMTTVAPVALASGTKYGVTISLSEGTLTVFKWKGGNWLCVDSIHCISGNPYEPTEKGTFYVSGHKKSYSLDGLHYTYATFLGSKRNAICAMSKKERKKLGDIGTMGQVVVSSSKARWLYHHLPVGTKLVIK